MKNNLHYFKISQENKEPHLDQDYFILEKHPELKKYLSGIKEIKEILITIKKLTNSKENKSIIDKYFLELFEIFKNNFSNCSELGCFVNACDTTRDLIQKDFESFKRITSLFIKKRKLDDKIPENWVQAIIDSNSSRKKGDLGERKIINFLIKQGYKEVKEWNLDINVEPDRIEANVLKRPQIFTPNNNFNDKSGTMQVRTLDDTKILGTIVHQPIHFRKWAIFCLEKDVHHGEFLNDRFYELS